MRTSVSPNGFIYGIHKPSYLVQNLRTGTKIETLGTDQYGNLIDNSINYPQGDVNVAQANWIYEIANPFPFRGSTYIGKNWADRTADDLNRIRLPPRKKTSLSALLKENNLGATFLNSLPRPLLLGLATTTTDPDDLVRLAHLSCLFATNGSNVPLRLKYRSNKSGHRPQIEDHELFEAVANNPALPDNYKIAMVIRPGAQGASEIVGDYDNGNKTKIYEYLRRNSYIAGGHYAANMADTAVRYSIDQLEDSDLSGLRHLYYQRTYSRLADHLGIRQQGACNNPEELETVRKQVLKKIQNSRIDVSATLWGWNFGFDYAPNGYRLHASHQQIHQQYALIPNKIETFVNGTAEHDGCSVPFSSGDMVAEVIDEYQRYYHRDFFSDYLNALIINRRMDERHDRTSSLVIWEDANVLLFVPKAQTSQWELQLWTKPKPNETWPGNILETDITTRRSIDTGLLKAQQCLAGRGARMVTSIEYPKRFCSTMNNQPLIYCLLPKLPESPGAFSETQLRFINGHYPEDFAEACRISLSKLIKGNG